ncbi:MAG: hypothetical protein M3Y82_06300 [Verrucomicrobiota bacterium]|nr:hypothetical protein [Verrucomicrobiota bacterium]
MKIITHSRLLTFRAGMLLSLIALSIFTPINSLLAQGQLTPTAPPGPTMKSLAQIEPRTPISTAPFTINASGSYYLTGNLNVSSGDAITINASGVTLDLNGFTISSTASTAAGMAINLVRPNQDITILNGHIQGGVTYSGISFSTGPGFQNGIGFSGLTIQLKNVRISGVSVSGVSLNGIAPGQDSSVIDHCEVRTAGGVGLSASTVTDSVANTCGSTAISAFNVANSRGIAVGGALGVSATTASNCIGESDTGTGLSVQNATTSWGRSNASGTTGKGVDAQRADNCTGFSQAGTGLNATIAINCWGATTSGVGLNATSAMNSFGSSDSGIGLNADNVSNSSGTSTSNYGLAASNASNCSGASDSSYGLFIPNADYSIARPGGTASFCRGYSRTSFGIFANIGIGCNAMSVSGSPEASFGYKYLMP